MRTACEGNKNTDAFLALYLLSFDPQFLCSLETSSLRLFFAIFTKEIEKALKNKPSGKLTRYIFVISLLGIQQGLMAQFWSPTSDLPMQRISVYIPHLR